MKFQHKEFRRHLIFDGINAVLFSVSSFYILYCLSIYYINNVISIADFTLYFTTITAMSATLGTITELIAKYNKQLRHVADYKRLKKLTGQSSAYSSLSVMPFEIAANVEIPSNIEICFSDVWFAYPGSNNYVLRGINIKIRNREKLVIVGYNGAGKSTFIKLLCKFYQPTKGKITLNGKDIWAILNEQYYRIIGAVFQDFALLAFTIYENITMCENISTNENMHIDENISMNENISINADTSINGNISMHKNIYMNENLSMIVNITTNGKNGNLSGTII